MFSNTVIRIISAVVMIALISLSLYIDIGLFKGLLGLIGVLVIDELCVNVIKGRRISVGYISTQLIFISAFAFMSIFEPSNISCVFISAGMNLILLIYLFGVPNDAKGLIVVFKKIPLIFAVYLLFSLYPILWLAVHKNWMALLCTYFLINFGMDSGGWFFGKNWGRHKLWASVSPKKTVEGLIGGILSAGLLGVLSWNLFFGELCWEYFLIYCCLGLISQLGDLVQSKIKRQAGIKDSSNLIPGHGGVFDRIDSLVFMAPFFILIIWSL